MPRSVLIAGVPEGRTIRFDSVRRSPQRVWDGLNTSLMETFKQHWFKGEMTPWRGYAPPAKTTPVQAADIKNQLYEMLWACYQVAMEERAVSLDTPDARKYVDDTTHRELIAGLPVIVRENGEPVTEGTLARKRLQNVTLPGWSLTASQQVIALLRDAA